MKQEQALQVLIQVCEKSNRSGVFTLGESALVLKALEVFGVKAEVPNNLEDSEDTEEVKEKKKN